MIKKLLLLVGCAVFIGDCAPHKRKLIFPPVDERQPPIDGINIVRVRLGESFSETLPTDPQARFAWEVVWDKKMLAGSQSQGKVCLNDNDDSCLKVIKYKFKAMQVGEALIEFRLKEQDSTIESFTSRVIVAAHKEIPKPTVR